MEVKEEKRKKKSRPGPGVGVYQAGGSSVERSCRWGGGVLV